MATQPLAEASQQLWDETLTRLLNLSTATVKRNVELENRVSELEVELSVWKQAHSVALEASERETKAHNVQVTTLNRQISNLDCFRNQNPLILCIVNGDENVFIRDLLVQGQQGGRAAAQQLTKSIAEYLSNEDVHVFGRLSFWITVYYNKVQWDDLLRSNKICTSEQFEGFLSGFSQSSPRFLMVDVGYYKDTTDSKIKEYLQTYTRFPQTLRIFFCGGQYDVSGYMSTFDTLEKEQLLGKIVILRSSNELELDSRLPFLPRLTVEGLFMTEKLTGRGFPKLTPLTVGSFSNVTTNGGLISPQSPTRAGGRMIDPSLPLHRQNPPPCNEHYLMTCSKGAAICKYSHDYILTPEQLASLASNAKKAPCNWLKNGVHCPYGENCCWGHTCPNGPKCFHLSKGKCWFKGEAMHSVPSSGERSPSSGSN
ncbi:hypothetical protein E4T56_gene6781 [Termitomyces sp. T112]|nr:hypothetical protein E4T56_gene6781 [Termitomyces sp. T112]KAH0587294.1 hypothetical protein H2248_006096 [Termitomyces sp. 'cryptogamus']